MQPAARGPQDSPMLQDSAGDDSRPSATLGDDADALEQLFDRLPGYEPWLTAGRLSKPMRARAAPNGAAPEHDAHGGSAPLPLWYVMEQWPRLSQRQRATAAARAARHGDLDALRWMGGQKLAWVGDVCTTAAAGGHLEVLQWLLQQEPPCPWSEGTCLAAAKSGHLEVAQWLLDQQCPWGGPDSIIRAAQDAGHAHVPEWLQWKLNAALREAMERQAAAHARLLARWG